MSIILPDFKDRKCLDVQLCGWILKSDYVPKELPPSIEEPLVAEYESSGQKVIARLVLPFPLDEDGDVHVHVEFMPVRGQRLPEPNVDISEIQSRLDHFIIAQKVVFVRLTGTFQVAIAELPSFIRPMLEETSGDSGIRVRMTAGTLSLRGAPIQAISWRLLDRESRAEMILEARTKREIGESYIVEELDKLDSAFKALVTQTSSRSSLVEKHDG